MKGEAFIKNCLNLHSNFKENVPYGIHVFPADTGGPLASAEAVRGNDIFMDFYDDCGFVEALLDKLQRIMYSFMQTTKKSIKRR